ALLKLVNEVRSDVRILANDLLMHVQPLRPCLLPVKNMGSTLTAKGQIRRISNALDNDEALIIFPAGEVSRFSPRRVRDTRWQKGFLSIAEKSRAPILPIHINGKNSLTFYTASMLFKPLSTAMLVGEMFKQQENQISFTVGSIIPWQAYGKIPLPAKERVKLLKKHLYRIGKGRKPLFDTENAVARPERRSDLKQALIEAELLGTTPDGKQIYLYSGEESSPILREIGRLREITFRAVAEGTGNRRDMDRFDTIYQHLILWDGEDLEIVGAYRFTDSAVTIKGHGLNGLYTNSLFNFDKKHCSFLDQGLELGRSFVQQRYWGKRSLDYLWYGIGAYLARNPKHRYLFGPVSVSGSMPRGGKDLLIYFYKLYFGSEEMPGCSRNPFHFDRAIEELASQFSGSNRKKDFKQLKTMLKNMDTTVPPLYKQYSELCTSGGVKFIDFNIDPDFNDCVDGLVVVDIQLLKPKKRKRYINTSFLAE
ncbi:MAG: lysophospholipid acyltransferase family protein, partial [Thermodesulfobacteriota bacterium]|nr:lysophospholipid acyltransferase family protein [Thermodesulfobacteriota bacterium]